MTFDEWLDLNREDFYQALMDMDGEDDLYSWLEDAYNEGKANND